jgi:hypothetical protein
VAKVQSHIANQVPEKIINRLQLMAPEVSGEDKPQYQLKGYMHLLSALGIDSAGKLS